MEGYLHPRPNESVHPKSELTGEHILTRLVTARRGDRSQETPALGSPMNESSDALAVPIAVAMRRPTLLGPAMPILTASLIVRRARVEEAGPLAALLGRAYPAETWDAAGTEHELFGDETIRATLVVAAEERLLATASLQVHPDAPECAWLRWVATEQDRRREGLARALVIGVLAIAEQAGCREARLQTETDRLAAIACYLQLGFEPLVRSDPEREAWEQVIRFLRANDPYRKRM